MNTELSENTKAILLLAAPLIIGGRETNGSRILSGAEYNEFARRLREKNFQPADLLTSKSEAILKDLRHRFEGDRLKQLLGRGFQLSQAFETWRTRGIWIISRADPAYPQALKSRLKENAPPLLYGCGNEKLLGQGGLAIVGSRHVDEELLQFARDVGKLCAKASKTVISGGAKGIDRAAMEGALREDGSLIGVLAERLAQQCVAADCREPIREDRLILISQFDPTAGFNVGNAMQRNKLIYSFADAALVVNSDYKRGGTWAGAIEQLEKYHCCPIYVRESGNPPEGNRKLVEAGAAPWPNVQSVSELGALLAKASYSRTHAASELKETYLPGLVVRETISSLKSSVLTSEVSSASEVKAPLSSAEELFGTVRSIVLREVISPKSESELAEILNVPVKQVHVWLARLVSEGLIEKTKRPVRFKLVQTTQD